MTFLGICFDERGHSGKSRGKCAWSEVGRDREAVGETWSTKYGANHSLY